ncbi:hypothetical protein [Shewanella gelidii]|nr:hypothetical protein [Shewanella gelidii]MCL1096990.1 hypothetical protein [Shewanella gelidii]
MQRGFHQTFAKKKSWPAQIAIFTVVTLAHALVLMLLQQLWQPQAKNRVEHPQKSAAKLQAFLYIPQPKHNDKRAQGLKATPKIKPQKQIQTKPTIQQRKLEQKPVTSEASLNVQLKKQVSTKEAEEPQALPVRNTRRFTKSYLQKQRERAIASISNMASNQYTQNRSLSEMDGEVIFLDLPKRDQWQASRSFDSAVDPNRIIKQGNTCYRIVKNPTPINPNAENLGYPFRCDGKTDLTDLKLAIQKRIQNMQGTSKPKPQPQPQPQPQKSEP